MFYDVPMVWQITPSRYVNGFRVRGQMPYAIFDCPFCAMSCARRNGRGGISLDVNRRAWSDAALAGSIIFDRRNECFCND